jgi:hypothetical protein
MLKIYDYRCKASKDMFERMTHNGEAMPCKCGSTLEKVQTPISFRLDNSFPGYAEKWAKDHERGAKAGRGKG